MPGSNPLRRHWLNFWTLSEGVGVPPISPWFFPSSRGSRSGYTVAIENPFRLAVGRAGLNIARVVSHTAVSHLVQVGVSLSTVQRMSGPRLAIVARYAHQNGDHIRAAMSNLEGRISGTITPKLHKRKSRLQRKRPRSLIWLVPVKGIEPSTFSLQVSCSTN